MVSWFFTRHILFPRVCYSLYSDSRTASVNGCYWGTQSNIHGPIGPPDKYHHLITPFLNPQGLVCWNNQVIWIFLGMLLSLQGILLVWFGMIMRVAWKVIKGGEAEDSRSDDEEEGVEGLGICASAPPAAIEDLSICASPSAPIDDLSLCASPSNASQFIEVPPLEEEVGVDAINLSGRKSSPARRYRKGAGASSGVTLHSDRKELLGRIGCDKSS